MGQRKPILSQRLYLMGRTWIRKLSLRILMTLLKILVLRQHYDVAIFASGSWKKTKGENGLSVNAKKSAAVDNPSLPSQDTMVMDHNRDSDADEVMVDGVLSFGTKTDYALPSQADLIHSAFAGDDVEAEFEKDKMEVLNEENPEPEKPVLLPGWGQWTNVQQKRGLPSWMLQEHGSAKRKREEALKKRKDSKLKDVIISEKIDKKVSEVSDEEVLEEAQCEGLVACDCIKQGSQCL
ncbi:uncharacterized protein M6B38_392335 [Iris pallida]|uniref:Uncharacterized protein n=1 Tax=Iris pallida TaxID=29817 RepID=A0AAX6FZ12_IRIPA|nr:uncharacterized protein M6B38_392335 [Iris pallida]